MTVDALLRVMQTRPAAGRPPRMVRVAVSGTSPLTVTLPDGVDIPAVGVQGLTYTVGGAAVAFLTEPGIPLILPVTGPVPSGAPDTVTVNGSTGSGIIGAGTTATGTARFTGTGTLTSGGSSSSGGTTSVTDRSQLVLGVDQPDATNTGLLPGFTRSDLTAVSGTQTITTGNQTITGRDFRGRVIIKAPNITFKNCWFGAGSPPTTNSGAVDVTTGGTWNLLIEDSVIAPDTPSLWLDCIVGHDYTLRRVHAYHGVDTFGIFNSHNSNGPVNVTIEQSYGHDLAYFTGDPNHSDGHTHNDAVQIQGNSGATLRGNTLWANIASGIGNAGSDPYYPSATGQAIGFTPNVGPITGTLIEENWIDYGAQSITAITGGFSTAASVGTIRLNRFGRNQPSLTKASGTARRAIAVVTALTFTGMRTTTGADTQGNVYDDTGTAVTVYRINDL